MEDETTQDPAPETAPVVTAPETAPATQGAEAGEAYLFPTYGVTVNATSLEDAEQKLQDQIKTS